MKVASCLVVLLAVAGAVGSETETTKTWVLRDTVAFDLSEGWEFVEGETTARVEFVNHGLEASCMLAPSPDEPTAAKYGAAGIDRDATLKQTLEKGLAPMLLPRSVEKALDIQPVPGSDPTGFYFTLTNTDGRIDTVAVNYLASMELVMICGTARKDDVPAVLSILGSVRAETN